LIRGSDRKMVAQNRSRDFHENAWLILSIPSRDASSVSVSDDLYSDKLSGPFETVLKIMKSCNVHLETSVPGREKRGS